MLATTDSVHRLVAYVCFVVGIALNGTLLLLIWKRARTEVRVYSRILLQTALVGIAHLVLSFAYTPVLVVRDSRALVYGVGPLCMEASTPGAQRWNLALHLAWTYVFFFGQYSVTVPFIHRYFSLCRQRLLPLRAYAYMLLGVGVICILFIPSALFGNAVSPFQAWSVQSE